MKRLTLQFVCLALLVLVIASVAFAGGYQLNEHGARATAMGGAFVARAADASAIFFNPAGLAFQKGINILAGGTLILPSTKFKYDVNSKETSMNSLVFFPPNVYGTYEASDEIVVGLGIFSPYGLGTEWPDSWDGQLLAVKATLQTFYVNPTISYKVNDELSVGLGLSYVYGSVDLKQRLPQNPLNPAQYPRSTDGTLSLSGTGSGFGFNLGVLYKPMPELSVGASFRSLTDIEFSGTAEFSGMLSPTFKNGDGKAKLPMPTDIFVGAAYQVMPELSIEGDFQYVDWTAYDKLTVTLPSPLGVQTTNKTWNAGYLLRGGAEYKYDAEWTLRGGVILDLSPQPPSKTEPMLPDGDRVDISVGAGYKIDQNWSVDVAYMLVLFMERKTNNPSLPGTYNSTAHLIGFDVAYAF